MKIVNRTRLMAVLLTGTLLGLGSLSANAATTVAGTSVLNRASVGYSIGGNTQTAIESSPTGNSTAGSGKGADTTFVVDNKLILTVVKVGSAAVNVSPNQATAVLVYQVTNSGNATQGVSFTAASLATGAANPFGGAITDDFDSTGAKVYVSKNNSVTYVSANDTAASIPQLAAGAQQYVFVVSTIPIAQVNGDLAVMSLTAQVAAAGGAATYGTAPGADITSDDSGTAWTSGTMQKIFADAAGTDDAAFDGKASDRSAYLVQSAKLTITKTSAVITDPVYCTTPGLASSCTIPTGKFLHSIPGAAVQYTILVASCDTTTCPGATAATGVSLTDNLGTEITAGHIAYKTGSMTVSDPSNSNVSTACTDGVDGDKCSYASSTVSVSGISLNPGQNAAVTFMVTIP